MAHALTITGWENSSYYEVPTVNGVEKTNTDSPITLKNGDVIRVPTDRRDVTINGTSYVGQTTTLDLANQDIALVATGGEKTPDTYHFVTINYTESGGSTKVNVDLTTLSGYESLPAGTYALGVKAKASGYTDSDLSQTVSFTKLAAPVATAADTTVTWDAVTNAESYDVYVDDELYENTTGGGK